MKEVDTKFDIEVEDPDEFVDDSCIEAMEDINENDLTE